MGSCYSIDHIAEDPIHTSIAYNIEEPQQKYCLGTVSNRLLGGLNMFYRARTSPSASAIAQSNLKITTNASDQYKTFNIYFCDSLFFLYIKHKMKQNGQL